MELQHLQHWPSEGLDQVQHCSHHADCSQRSWPLRKFGASEAHGRSVGEGLDGACSRLLFATSQNLFFQVLYCFYALFFLLSMLLFFLYCFLTWARASSAEMTFNMDETDRSFIQRLWAPSAQHTSTSIALFEGDRGSAEWRSTLAIYVSGWASSGRGEGLAFLNRVAGKAPPGWRSDEGGGQHHLWDIGGFLIPF